MNQSKLENYSGILKKAYEFGKEMHPEAPNQYHCAFANSVACFCTGASGGYGGPSVREHTTERMGSRVKRMGEWEFEEAIAFCDAPCYGELTELHHALFRQESCFHDAPQDLEVLRARFQKA